MNIKTSELIGAALDWAVAKCEGAPIESPSGGVYWPTLCNYSPSTHWAQGGPIIEREKLNTWFEAECPWHSVPAGPAWGAGREGIYRYGGPTPLIAAMRCLVASKFGEEVEIPIELGERQ